MNKKIMVVLLLSIVTASAILLEGLAQSNIITSTPTSPPTATPTVTPTVSPISTPITTPAPTIPPPPEQWNKTFGGTKYDYAESVQQTSDGGYILAGYTTGFNDENAWLIKTGMNGNEMWNKTFGKGMIKSVQQTKDGGYILAGSAYPPGGSWDQRNAWLIKTDASGNEMWNKTFGVGVVESVQQTSDGGYILAGYRDAFVAQFIKTDASGNEMWNKIFSVTMADYAHSVQQTSDGGYIFAGMSSGNALLVKTDASGNQQWNKTFSVTMGDIAQSVQQTSDGGYILAGYSYGNVLLIKTDTSGNQQWSKIFGGKLGDFGYSVQQTSDGGYILAGQTTSNGAGGNDAWLIRTDSNGNKIWDKTFGGTGDDFAHSVQKTSDGGYILAGSTTSYGTGTPDAWLIKVSSEILIPTPTISPTPTVTATPTAIAGFKVKFKVDGDNVNFIPADRWKRDTSKDGCIKYTSVKDNAFFQMIHRDGEGQIHQYNKGAEVYVCENNVQLPPTP